MANTSPFEVRNAPRAVTSDGRFTLGNVDLDYDDNEQPDAQIVYTITTAPASGTVTRSGVALSVGGSFSQADIDAGRVTYNGALAADGSLPNDRIGFQVTDGQGGYVGGKQFLLTGISGYRAGEIVNTGLTVVRGGSVVLQALNLAYDNGRLLDSAITFTVTTAPTAGTLRNNGTAIAVGGTFTQDDINLGRVTFLQNGSAATTASFGYQITDSQGAFIQGKSFAFGVAAANTAPVESFNTGFSIVSGTTRGISPNVLNYRDAEQNDNQIYYTITSLPSVGTLTRQVLTANGTYETVTLKVGDRFVDSDLIAENFVAANRINYTVPAGTASTDTALGFSVSDGVGGTVSGRSLSIFVEATNTPPVRINALGTTTPGNVAVLTPDNLRIIDAEQTASQIFYGGVRTSYGVLQKDGVTLTVSDRFTQQDVNDGRIRFVSDGPTVGTVTLAANDSVGGALDERTLEFRFVASSNTAPFEQANNVLRALPGQTVKITGGNLDYADREQNDANVIYTITSGPAAGTLLNSSLVLVPGSRFTQQDIEDGRIMFRADAAQPSTVSIGFQVSDGKGGYTTDRTLTINDAPVTNTAPFETTNLAAKVMPGQFVQIITSNLDYNDREQADGAIVYTITSAPTAGTLQRNVLNAPALGVGATFTQAEITSGILIYRAGANQTGPASFGFSVSDGQGGTVTGKTFTIETVTGNTSPFEVTNTGLRVAPGQVVTINSDFLDYNDREQKDFQIVYEISSLPVSGSLMMFGNVLKVGSRFTESLDSGSLTYRADVNQTGSGTFGFAVLDGAGGYVGGKTFRIDTVGPNTAPFEASNTGLRLASGQTVTIAATNLDYDDREQADTAITYTITTAPAAGAVLLGGTALGVGGRFTQDDVNAGRVAFRADTGQPTTASFGFQVSDGQGGAIDGRSFRIDATANTSPFESINTGLRVTSGQTVTIAATNLDYNDREQADTSIFFTVTTVPSAGAVLLNGAALGNGGRFTQDDLNAGRVSYRADAPQPSTASFGFQVTDGAGGYVGGKTVQITGFSANTSPFETVNTGLRAASGQTVTIAATNLDYFDREQADTSIFFTVTSAPTAGTILRSGVALTTGSRFTQDDINLGLVSYRADASQPSSASFGFQVTDGQGGYVGGKTVRIDLPAAPNTSPFETVNTGLRVTSGQTVTIAATNLDYDDREQADTSIFFTVTSAPSVGTILRNGAPLGNGGRFTQDDINLGLISYRADAPRSAMIGFQVTDGQGGYVGGKTIRITANATSDVGPGDIAHAPDSDAVAHAFIIDPAAVDAMITAVAFDPVAPTAIDPGPTLIA